ncbi:hypothetical protein DFH09DRAFT_901848 [Mycena vulgaris]|nr:hypothetical protein DFH09DRAFT_901848 [Mycena vulgaris]
MVDIPNEIFLQIFPHLCLKSIIAAHGVSQLWRRLLNASDIDSTRRELWSLYRSFVNSTAFLESHPWTLEHLQSFDRQAYVDALLNQHDHLPHSFLLYLLEWPAKAVISCLWPGLPQCYFDSCDGADDIELPRGCNFLSCLPPSVLKRPGNSPAVHSFLPPLVHTVTYTGFDAVGMPVRQDLPAFLVWEEYQMSWLILESSEFEGQVWNLCGSTYSDDDEEIRVDANWIEFLKVRMGYADPCGTKGQWNEIGAILR